MISETPRLILREYAPDDFDALFSILSDPLTMRYYPKPCDEAQTRRWIDWSLQNYREHGFGWWALILKETGQLIGDCGITIQPINGQNLPEIGYHIHRNHWRRGYGKEAARAVRDWGFENTGYDCLYSYMTQANNASYSLAESIGMKRIGQYREEPDGLLYIYAINREEWRKIRQS